MTGIGDLASLMKPFFYQDNAHTFFVEPSVTERTIEEWPDWVTPTLPSEPEWLKKIEVKPFIPKGPIPDHIDLIGGFLLDESIINPPPKSDWVTNPYTLQEFDGSLIGPAGQPGLKIFKDGSIAEGGMRVNVNPGSSIATGSTVVLTGRKTLEQNGLKQIASGLNIVGGAGFNSVLEKNFITLRRML